MFYRPKGLLPCNYCIKTDSQIACHAHAVPLPRRALIHTCHAAPLPCSDSAVSPEEAKRGQVSRRPCCAVAMRRTAWSEHGKCETVMAALTKSNGKDTF
jgi:hypothetical protein